MKRGAQTGNQNARRSHTRIAVSFDGAIIDDAIKRMTKYGHVNPTDKEIKEYLKNIVRDEFAAPL